MSKNPNHARINRLKFSVMEEINDLVQGAIDMGRANPGTDDLTEWAGSCTSEIAEIVQGENNMSDKELIRQVVEMVWCHPEKDVEELIEMFSVKPEKTEFVSKYYEIDPVTEDVLHNGTLVIDDMKVLIETSSIRVEIQANMTEGELYAARTYNRWATVTESKVKTIHDQAVLTFVALYDDGTKRKITQDANLAWIVKKDSIPRIDTLMNEGGSFLEELPTAKMVAFLKEREKVSTYWDPTGLKIQTGEGGDVIPLEKYLAIEDPQPEQGE